MVERAKSLSDRELDAMREIADILIPESFHVWGYTKETVIEGILKSIEDGPAIIPIKMRMIYNILRKCYM